MSKQIRVIVTAGYSKSLHSIALMDKLLDCDIEVVGCIQIKTFQFRRFRQYLKQYGWNTLKSKFYSYVLGSKTTYLRNELIPIEDYISKNNIKNNTEKTIIINLIIALNIFFNLITNLFGWCIYSAKRNKC